MPAQDVLQKAFRERDLRTTIATSSGQQGTGLGEDAIWDSVHLNFIFSFIRIVRV